MQKIYAHETIKLPILNTELRFLTTSDMNQIMLFNLNLDLDNIITICSKFEINVYMNFHIFII